MTEESTKPDPATTYQFNWRTLDDYDYQGFLKWALVHLTVSQDSGVDLLPQLVTATDDLTDVRLYVEVNGVVVDPRELFEAIHANMAKFAREAATEALEESVQFRDLKATLAVLQSAAIRRVELVASGLGIDLDVERLRSQEEL